MRKESYSIELRTPEEEISLKRRMLGIIYDVISIVCMSVAGVSVILILFFRMAVVEGDSMNPTLHDGDDLIITSIGSHYNYGDIVVVHREDDVSIVKRVIAVAGDTIDIDFDLGKVYLNGSELLEDYILEPTYRSFSDGPEFPLTVPEGFVFVMGDNRNNSLDSRSGSIGLINEQYIVGKMIHQAEVLQWKNK